MRHYCKIALIVILYLTAAGTADHLDVDYRFSIAISHCRCNGNSIERKGTRNEGNRWYTEQIGGDDPCRKSFFDNHYHNTTHEGKGSRFLCLYLQAQRSSRRSQTLPAALTCRVLFLELTNPPGTPRTPPPPKTYTARNPHRQKRNVRAITVRSGPFHYLQNGRLSAEKLPCH